MSDKLVVTAAILSRNTFSSVSRYDQRLNDEFKKIGGTFDKTERHWVLAIEKYPAYLEALRRIGPDVVFEPIPDEAMRIVRNPVAAEVSAAEISADDASKRVGLRIKPALLAQLMPFQRVGCVAGSNDRILLTPSMLSGCWRALTGMAVCYSVMKWGWERPSRLLQSPPSTRKTGLCLSYALLH